MTLTASQQQTDYICPVCLAHDTTMVRPYRTGPVQSFGLFAGLTIRACGRCETAFASPLPEENALEAFYAGSYRAERGDVAVAGSSPWDGGSIRARAQVEFVMERFSLMRSWLDIGAGHGSLLDEARRRHIARTGAIEPDIKCGEHLRAAGHHLYCSLADVRPSWDVVSCSHVLEHLPNPRQFLRNVQRLLSPEGHVFCEVPNETALPESPTDLPHLLFFTLSSLKRLFQDSGFAVIAVSSCGRGVSKNRKRELMTAGFRRIYRGLFRQPSRWIDRLVHPHFYYSTNPSMGAWLRLLARKAS